MTADDRNIKVQQFLETVDGSDDWESLVSTGMEAREDHDLSQWILGDSAERVYEMYGQQGLEAYAIQIFVRKSTLSRYKDVARKIPRELRDKYKLLSWSHFRIAAGRTDVERALQLAADNDWSVENMANQLKKIDGKPVPPLPKVKMVECPYCRKFTLSGPKELLCTQFKDCGCLIGNGLS